MARIPRGGALPAVLALSLIAPLAAGMTIAIVKSSESPLESATEPEPVIAAVQRAERNAAVTVSVTAKSAAAQSPATDAAGTLTALALSVGSKLDTGAVLGSVDHRDLVAYVAETPLAGDVARGHKGTDVATAQRLLSELGFYDGAADGVAGAGTVTAIKAFNAEHGYGKTDGVLHRASLVWLGTAPATVAELLVPLGSQVSPGTALFTATAGLAAITVAEPPVLPPSEQLTLTVNGVAAPYEPGSGAVTEPEHVEAIAAALTTEGEAVGSLELTVPQVVGTVPASAVFADDTGATCLFPDATAPPVTVAPTGGTLGTVDLDDAMVGTPVLVNPREVREDLSCGS